MKLFKNNVVPYASAEGDKIYPIVVDIKKGIKSGEAISFVTADNQVGVITIDFMDGNSSYSIEGCMVTSTIHRPDGTVLEIPCDIISQSTIEIPLGVNGTYQEGVHTFDLKIFRDSGKIIGVPTMNYTVHESLSSDDYLEEEDKLPVIAQLTNQVIHLKNEWDIFTDRFGGMSGGGDVSIDLSQYALKSEVPSKTSQLVNDSGYLTSVPKSLSDTVSTHTSQIDGLSKELDSVKKVTEGTVTTVTTDKAFTTFTGTTGGYVGDVKVNGKTLVNLATTSKITITDTSNNVISRRGFKKGEVYTLAIFTKNKNTASKIYLGYSSAIGDGSNSLMDLSVTDYCVNKFRMITDENTWGIGGDTGFKGSVDIELVLLEGDHTDKGISYFEGLKNVGQDTDEISVSSTNSDNAEINKKQILYFNLDTQTWETPILREWDSIEKHPDGNYYYHKRSEEVVLNGSERWVDNGMAGNLYSMYTSFDAMKKTLSYSGNLISDRFKTLNHHGIGEEGISGYVDSSNSYEGENWIYINTNKTVTELVKWLKDNPVTVAYQLAKEEVYECTNLDLMSYSGETNLIVSSGAIQPKVTLNVLSNISNAVNLLQERVSVLENKFIAGLQQVLAGDMYSLAHLLYPEDFENNHEIQTLEL